MTVLYYAHWGPLDTLPVGTLLSPTREQALIHYAYRDAVPGEINPMLAGTVYHLLIDTSQSTLPSQVDHTTDVDFKLASPCTIHDGVHREWIRMLMFSPDTPLRELTRVKTKKDIGTWMETYRPVSTLSAYLDLSTKVMRCLADLPEASDKLLAGRILTEAYAELQALGIKLSEEFHAMENEIIHLKQLLADSQNSDKKDVP